MALELFITNDTDTISADIDDSVRIVTERFVTAFRNPTSGTGSYTYNFKLPATATNRRIFNHADDKQVLNKFGTTYAAVIVFNGVRIIKGQFELKSINKGFTGNITGSIVTKLSDIIPDDKKLRAITSFTPVPFLGGSTVVEYMKKESLAYYPKGTVAADKSEIAFAYTLDSFNAFVNGHTVIGYEDIGVSHFVGSIFENILADAGYKVAGNILTTDAYKRLLVLYSNADGIFQEWNYGVLNPFKAVAENTSIARPTVNISTTIDRYDDRVYVVQPTFQNYQGDLSDSLGDDGVYTCKASGLYTIRMKSPMAASVIPVPGAGDPYPMPSAEFKHFYAFRCITNTEFLKASQLPSSSSFDSASAALYVTELDTFFIGEGEFIVNMVEGQQYAVQAYISLPKKYAPVNVSIYNEVNKANYLDCTKFDGKMQLNPADFLPDLSCKKFVEDLFKLYNLYYTIDSNSKTVTIYTRDEFFLSTITDTIDITDRIDFDEWEETPITDAEINANYYKWKDDDSDYILKATDYMQLVNGTDNKSDELSFSPLAFIRKEYEIYPNLPDYTNIKTVSDFFPAIIPYNESNDIRLLSDTEAENNNTYSPRICYYLGNVFTSEYMQKQASYAHLVPLKGYEDGYVNARVYAPRLTFFDLANQPAYEVVIDTVRRDFSLKLSTVPNLFKNGENIIKPMVALKSLDVVSDNSSFLSNYREVIQLNKFSNYITTSIRLNPVLFDKLDGRNLLKINNLTYLLDSVTEYDMANDTAKIKVYRNI